MTPEPSETPLTSRLQRFRPHASKAALLLLGVALGAGLVALFSPGDATETPSEGHDHSHETADKQQIWTCSMHPQVRKTEPGKCPICGMDLIPASSTSDANDHEAAPIELSKRAQALARLRTTVVRRKENASGQLHLLGQLEPDETTLRTVTAWTGGRIDRLQVNVTGQRVRAGQVIATLYSPEVFAAHQDLLVAKRQVERMANSPNTSRQAAEAALAAARQRLRLLGVPDDQLARMEGQESPTRAVAIRSPFAGTVIERLATEGAYVSTGTPLYRIANLRTLWVQLDAYESDLSRLSVGQPVEVTVEAFPGEVFEGKVMFIDPTVDPRRRTAQVRVQVDNRNGHLRPGMFADALVTTHDEEDGPNPLVIPESAPLFTGRRAVVYVEVHDGDRAGYEPRTVRLGPRLGDVYPVVAGLSEGERVVTRGAFALDADLQIRGGASMMSPTQSPTGDAPDEGAIVLSATQRATLAPIVEAYLGVQQALAGDNLKAATDAAHTLLSHAQKVKLKRPKAAVTAWAEISPELKKHAQHVAGAESLERAREGFEPLSAAIISLLGHFGNPLGKPVRLAFCPMASGSDGALWVQQEADIRNAYFGASMLTCGEVRQEVPPGSFLSPAQAKPQEHQGHSH